MSVPVVVRLRRPEEMVAVEPAGLLDDDGEDTRTVPAVDEILSEVLSRRRVGRRDRLVLEMPAPGPPAGRRRDDGPPGEGPATLGAAPPRGRRARGRTCSTARVWRRCGPGLPLFVIGLLLSTDFLAPDVPEFFQSLLGDGVFLVIAWVGLWYPLDLLFFARLPLRRQRRALDALRTMPVEVRAPAMAAPRRVTSAAERVSRRSDRERRGWILAGSAPGPATGSAMRTARRTASGWTSSPTSSGGR